LPGFLELWARWSDSNKSFWVQTPAAARGLLRNACHSSSGLYPDYSSFNGQPYKPSWAGYNTEKYQYDACRSAMNVGMDWNWFATDNQQPTMTERTLTFFKNDGCQHAYFNWDGSGAEGYYNQAMQGSNGAAALAIQNNDALAKRFVENLWNTSTPTGLYRYYNGLVYFLGMLHTAGYFKIYKPCPEVVEENLSGPAPIEFNGEQYSKDTTFKTLIDCKIYDVTITIEAAANTYTVSFVDYDDSEIASVEVAEGETATAPDDPTREGYDFAGWDTDFSNVTSDLTVKATYTIKTFTVSFVDYDDSPIGTAQTVEYGQAATAPTEPTREHYTFKQWDTDFTNVKADLTVKAVYEENAKADYNALNAALAQADALTEDDYTAATWSALQTALTAAKAVDADLYVEDQAIVDAATSALTSAIAALQEITFTVTFVDWDDTPIGDAQIIKKGGAAQAPANPTREGYTFVGWDTEFTNVTSDLTVKATYNKKDAGSKYEAENAQNNNTQTVTNTNASGGKYVRMNEGSLTFTVNVASAGMYTAKFAYSLTEDYKAQYLSVNGSQVGTVGFNKSGSSDPTFATVEAYVMLNEGSNTIALTKSWGYVAIDYLEISSYERTQFNIDEALVTPSPQPATVEVYEFLKDNFGKKTISGVMTLDLLNGSNTLPLASQSEVSYINSKSGKTPALVGFDFMHSTGKNSTNDWQQSYTQAAIAMAEELWNAGGIPTFSWHWRDPNQNNDSFNTSETSFDLTKAFANTSYTAWNTNSTEYKNMIKDIDIIAGYLEELQCAGVTILWRPIHEASGKWFWWGAKGAEPYKQLYKLLFDRLVNYHQIHNLIWVWNSDGTDADWYPGDEYVDVVGRDFYYSEGSTYNHSSLVCDFEALAKQTNGKKLVTLAENGAVPYPENMATDNAMWSWFMPWYGEYVTSSNHNTASDWNTIMNDSHVITLGDMTGWDNRTKVYDTTTVGTLYAKNGFSVTSSKEGDSEHEITVTSSHNCDSVVVLYLHANAAAIVNYTVTFVDYDGTTLKTEEVEEGKSATAPDAPTREHYTFKEWDTDFSNVTSDLTVTAVYEENAKADYTALNAAIAQAEALTEDDYTAETWSSLQTALTSAKAVDKDLYAESQSVVDAATEALASAISALVEQTYTVTFVGKDGSTLKEQTVKKGESATAPEAPEIEGFTFSGWLGSFENVTADVTITAQYTEKGKADYTALNTAIAQAEALNEGDYTAETWSSLQTVLTSAKAVDKDLYAESQSIVDAAAEALTSAISALVEQTFTVTFVGKDGNILKEQTVKKGESATVPEAPEIEGFTFSGWSGSFENVTADVTITAQYTEKGKADYTALNAAIAQAEALTEGDYTAQSWSSLQTALTNAKAVDKDLYAESQSVVDAATEALTSAISALVEQTFTVTFVDKDGNTLKEQIVKKGESATAPEAPEIEGFTFSGWSGSFENVTADVTITAVYTENGKAVYVDLDNAINIAEALVQASYTDATWSTVASALTSAKLVDRNLHIEDQNIVDAATEALTSAISALVVKTFTVTFVADGEEVDSQTIEYGKNATAPANPTKDGYDFVAWNGNYTNVTADVTITAEFKVKTFTIKFVDWDGTELSVQAIEYGNNAVPPTAPTRDGYVFQEWVGTYQNVMADAIVVASYNELSKANYTALDQAIAIAKAKSQSDYTSDSWTVLQTALASAEAVDRNLLAESQSEVDQETTALNAAIGALVLQTYTVEFVVDGEVVSTQEVAPNASAIAPSTPVKLGFNFDHWDKDFSSVTADMTITAVFVVKTFTVRFVDWDNTPLSIQTVDYGGSATVPANPTREGYVFDGWNGSYENVVSEVTITAIYTEKGKASYTELDRTIASVANLREADYAVNTWIALQQALTQANAVDRNLFAEDQQIVDNANTALENAINALERLDRTTLASTISTANSLYLGAVEGQNKGQYPSGSKTVLLNAI
ncbi:MAG: InlB B-repeat-containing protein, partial [Bacteroidales bacterium]|nr:InlB B-repeat-containing protein [Bacteroidales bacterium]